MSYEQIEKASAMWCRGFDTLAIARILSLSEAIIYANLEAIKDVAFVMRSVA